MSAQSIYVRIKLRTKNCKTIKDFTCHISLLSKQSLNAKQKQIGKFIEH